MRADGSNWPKRLDRDAVYIVSMYKAGGVPVKVIAATYRAREQDVREFLKHHLLQLQFSYQLKLYSLSTLLEPRQL